MNSRKWSKAGIVLLAIVGIVAWAGMVYASNGGHGEAHSSVTPEKLKDLLWRTMNFAGLVVILVWALKKPIANGLKDRRESIKQQFEELEARKADAERVYKEYEAKLAKIDQEVNSLIDAAVKQGELEKQRIIEDAERAAGDIKRQAEMAVQYELAQATARLRSEIAEQAAQVAEELIRKNLKPEDQNKMVEVYLEKVGSIQ